MVWIEVEAGGIDLQGGVDLKLQDGQKIRSSPCGNGLYKFEGVPFRPARVKIRWEPFSIRGSDAVPPSAERLRIVVGYDR